jgi:hypothetical protein
VDRSKGWGNSPFFLLFLVAMTFLDYVVPTADSLWVVVDWDRYGIPHVYGVQNYFVAQELRGHFYSSNLAAAAQYQTLTRSQTPGLVYEPETYILPTYWLRLLKDTADYSNQINTIICESQVQPRVTAAFTQELNRKCVTFQRSFASLQAAIEEARSGLTYTLHQEGTGVDRNFQVLDMSRRNAYMLEALVNYNVSFLQKQELEELSCLPELLVLTCASKFQEAKTLLAFIYGPDVRWPDDETDIVKAYPVGTRFSVTTSPGLQIYSLPEDLLQL